MSRFSLGLGIWLIALALARPAGAQVRAVKAAPIPTSCASGQVLTPQGCLAQNPGALGEGVNAKGQVVAGSSCAKGMVLTSQGCQAYGAVISPGTGGLIGSGPNVSTWACENGRCCNQVNGACLASADQAVVHGGWICENGRCCDQALGVCH
jgi:hypothetical protein